MKIAICGDIHICRNSSLIVSRGKKYSTRLENCIKSLNWFEKVAKENNCEMEVFLGDTFDTASLDPETITAIKDVTWNEIPKYFLVGNHESSVSNLQYSSTKLLETNNFNVISQPQSYNTDTETLWFIPYYIESDRPALSEITKLASFNKKIIFSHNDLKGIQMGPVESAVGFTLDEINDNCDLFINGHLHNGTWVNKKVRNLGILTGKDFGEDANRYEHTIMILDTKTMQYTEIENPYAFNFYKLDILKESDCKKLYQLKHNAIISVRCAPSLKAQVDEIIQDEKVRILESRITIIQDRTIDDNSEVSIEDLQVDHLAKFVEFCKENINNTKVLENELGLICR